MEKEIEGQFGSSYILPRMPRGGVQFPALFVKVCLREGLRGAVSQEDHITSIRAQDYSYSYWRDTAVVLTSCHRPECPHLHTGEKICSAQDYGN